MKRFKHSNGGFELMFWTIFSFAVVFNIAVLWVVIHFVSKYW